jgi:hypothetical protein
MDERQLNALVVITDGNLVRAFHACGMSHADDFDFAADPIEFEGDRATVEAWSRATGPDLLEELTRRANTAANPIAERISSLVIADGASNWHLVAPPQLYWEVWDGLDPKARIGLKRLEFGHLIALFDNLFEGGTVQSIFQLNEYSSRATPFVPSVRFG